MSEPIMSEAEKSHSTSKQTPSRQSKLKPFKWLIIVVLLILGLIAAWKYWKSTQTVAEEYSQWSKPVPVRVVPVEPSDLQQQVKAIGTVIPSQMVNVQSQVPGR